MNTISNGGSATAVAVAQALAVAQIQPGQNVSDNPAYPEPSPSDVVSKADVAVDTAAVQGLTPSTPSKEQQQPTKSSIQEVTDKVNDFVESVNTDLRFQLHTKTDELMVQIVDSKTHKVLREAPSHQYLDMVAKIREYIGAIMDKKI